jgi:hypothetical protein
VSEKRMLRKIFGPKKEGMAGGWKRLDNEELHNLYVSPNIISVIKSRILRWAGRLACMREMRNAYSILVRKPEGKRPRVRSRHRWEENIGMDLREICLEDVNWIHLAQDRDQWRTLVNTVMNLRVQ